MSAITGKYYNNLQLYKDYNLKMVEISGYKLFKKCLPIDTISTGTFVRIRTRTSVLYYMCVLEGPSHFIMLYLYCQIFRDDHFQKIHFQVLWSCWVSPTVFTVDDRLWVWLCSIFLSVFSRRE
jgi:hypothetical protein